MNDLLDKLKEREKELICIYNVNKLLNESNSSEDIFTNLLDILPKGFRFPDLSEAEVLFEKHIYYRRTFEKTSWFIASKIFVDSCYKGELRIYYTKLPGNNLEPVFLPEEHKLLNTITSVLSNYFFNVKLRRTISLIRNQEKTDLSIDQNTLLANSFDEHWKWRFEMVQKIVEQTNKEKYGIVGIYLIGSVKESTSGPGSDIDILVHCRGNELQRNEFRAWINGWSLCLSEMNFKKTGYIVKEGLIDLHLITDEDVERKTSYAVMIGSKYNSAKLIG